MTASPKHKPGRFLYAASILFPISNYLAQGIFWPLAPLLFRLENTCGSQLENEQLSLERIDLIWTTATLISRMVRWLLTPLVVQQVTKRFSRSLPQLHASFFVLSALLRICLSCGGRNILIKLFGFPAIVDPVFNLYLTLAVYSASCVVDIIPSILTEQVMWRSSVVPFGVTRGLGALVYGGAGALSAWLDGPTERVFAHGVLVIIAAVLALVVGSHDITKVETKEHKHGSAHSANVNDSEASQAEKKEKKDLKPLHQEGNKPIWLEHFPFLLIMFIINIFAQALPGYSMILLKTINTPQHIISASIAIACASELPVFYFSKRFLEDYGVRNMLSITTFAYFVRFIGYGSSGSYSPEYILIFKLLHGLTFATALSATLQYADDYVPKESNLYFNGLCRSLTHAMGGLAGVVITGFMQSKLGVDSMFHWLGWAAFVVFLYLRFGWRLKPKLRDSTKRD